MKKVLFVLATGVFFAQGIYAQTQKGNTMVGGDISQLGLDFQSHNTIFSLNIDPKMGWFVDDNKLLGAMLNFGISTQKGSTFIQYGVGAFGRYYMGMQAKDLERRAKWFWEANLGILGTNTSGGAGVEHSSTNGLGVGIGPGFSYFITPAIALEAIVKYNLTVGFGNSTTDNALSANLGFQIFLPGKRLKTIATPRSQPAR